MKRLKAAKLRLLHRENPLYYAKQILEVEWWFKQQEIVEALILHKRVFVKAGNGPGKTFLAGGLVNWFYDTEPRGLCLTTAPTGQQVKDVLWKEVRVQRPSLLGLQPKAPRMESGPDHFAVGYTAESAEAFQGRHAEKLFLVFDEATGIHADFWEAGEGMQPTYWLVMLNPTDTASRAYEEEIKDGWHVISLNGLEHPNVIAALAGEPIPYPKTSLTLEWVLDRTKDWCTPIKQEDARSADIEFPPGSGIWLRPGPLFEARVLGRWPSSGSTSIWTEAMWKSCLIPTELEQEPLQIGCDVARFGDDFTSMSVRRGNCALWHETHNGWDTSQTAGRLKQLCGQYADEGEDPKTVKVCIDDDGVGGGVTDQKDGYNFQAVSGANTANDKNDYPNRRSEAWFVVSERADEGRLDLSRLPADMLRLIQRQVMSPTWKLDSAGRRVVEPKADTKKRLGRSPDDADALNLAFGTGQRKIKVIKW